MKRTTYFIFCLVFCLISQLGYSQPDSCNVPLVGKGRIIDHLDGGTACLLCGSPDLANLIDGDLSNYATFNTTVVLLATPIISIKDVTKSYSAGHRAGFVVRPQGGLLDLGLLASFQIRTYLNNSLQETATTMSGLSLNLLGASGGKQRISFVTTLPFDEVELVQVATIGALTSLRVYYAYTESATGCDYDCRTAVVTGSPYSPSINGGLTGITGLCIGCSVTNTANVINANTNDAGTIFMVAGLGASGAIGINVGSTVPAGYDVGFAIAQNGGGLVDLSVLGATFIETYLGASPRETIAFSNLADVTVLGGNIQAISFKTTMSFDRVRIRINSLLSVLVNVNVHYAFVRPDDDNDGFPNCVDKCANANDNLDADGDGKPDACDLLDCSLNAGLDLPVCPPETTAQLTAAGPGQSWSPVAGNPSAATIDNSGLVSDMTVDGTYYFQLTGSNGCADTVALIRQESALDAACNNPISGFGVVAFDPSNGACLLCADVSLVVGGLLSAYVELDASLPIFASTPIIGVEDTLHEYPAGRRVGFVVEAVGGLIDLSLLSNFEIRTYLNGTLQETATMGNSLLTAGVLSGNGNRQRISFVTSQPFNAVVLVANAVLSTIDYWRIYYAFEEPTSCPDLALENCAMAWDVSNDHCAQIVLSHTGIDGLACVDCSINNIGNVIDSNESNFATINLTVGVGATASVAVKSMQTLNELYDVGFVVSGGVNLLDATVLGGFQLRTYMNNTLVDNYFATNALVDITLLGNGSDAGLVSFRPTGQFNEVRLTVYGLVSALQTTKVYSVFTRRDSDSDGTPDCMDKCCSGPDDMDLDGDGRPDACDTTNDPPLAVNDWEVIDEGNTVHIQVLLNDGDPNFDVIHLSEVLTPDHGTASIDGDEVVYTPDPYFFGQDTFQYIVCDAFAACDTAYVIMTVNAIKARLLLQMRLQGALYNSTDSLMRDDLRVNSRIPLLEPYSALNPVFVHVDGGGGEMIADSATVLADHGPNSIVDWVFIELRNANSVGSVVATRAALLQRDGDVVDVDGVSPLVFYNSLAGMFSVAVRHRNHLGSMIELPISVVATGTVLDFSNTATGLWDDGTNLNGLEQITIDGKFALWAGNVNTNTNVVFAGQNNDKDPIFNQVDQAPGNIFRSQTYVFHGYHLGDVNLNGRAVFAGQNNDVDPIFNNVDNHPNNVFRSQTFIIREQLASQ